MPTFSLKFSRFSSVFLFFSVILPLLSQQLFGTSSTFAYSFERACSKEINQKLKDIERSFISGNVIPKENQQKLSQIYTELTNCEKSSTEKTFTEEDYYLNFYYSYLDVYGKIVDAVYFQNSKEKLAVEAYKKLVALFHKDKKRIKKMDRQIASEIFALYNAILFDIMPVVSRGKRFGNSAEIDITFLEALRLSKSNNRLYLTRAQLEVVMPPSDFSIYKVKKMLEKLENMNDIETFHNHTISAALSIRTLDFEKAEYHFQQAEKIFPGNPSLYLAKQNAKEMKFFPQ